MIYPEFIKVGDIIGVTAPANGITKPEKVKRLDYAKKQGADVAINVQNLDLIEEINKLTDGEGVNVSIDAVCMPKTMTPSTSMPEGSSDHSLHNMSC